MSNVNVEQRREAIKAALRQSPGISDRQLGKRLGVHHVTVGAQRKALEAAGEIQRAEKTVGADGKAYPRSRTSRPKAPTPPTMDKLVSETTRRLVGVAKKDGRLDELAAAFQRYADRLAGGSKAQPKGTAAVHLPGQAMPEPASAATPTDNVVGPTAVDFDTPEVHQVVADPVAEAQGLAGAPSPVRSVRDVQRDITPSSDPDNDDYGAMPVEERAAIAQQNGVPSDGPSAPKLGTANGSEPEPGLERSWESGTIVHLHLATMCGRVHVPDYGDLNFDSRTLLEPGLVLKQGLELDVRLIERGRNWVQVVELAKPQVEA